MKFPSHPIAHQTNSRTAVCAKWVLIACTLLSERSAFAADTDTPAQLVDALPPLPAVEVARHREQQQAPRGQLALTVGVPVFFDEFLHGELSVDVRYGYKFWWFVPYLSGGFRQTRLDPIDWPWATRMQKLRAWHVTVGTRLEIPASRKLLPFFGIAVERSYWEYTDDSTPYCHESYYPNAWRCYKANEWKVGHALKPQIGLLYKPAPAVALEFWLEYVRAVAPDMFTRSVSFFHPALGIAWHH